ncbi:MAG: hypothetical protein R3B95_11455 [Nitrospirales bacterium]|nr:hypothetical protein [Nitrospirales bacterium]
MSEFDDELVLWDRLPGESVKAFAAFKVYRDMGMERSYRKVAKTLGRNLSWIRDWGGKYEWTRRVEAWEDHLNRLEVKAQEDAIKEMNKEQASVGRAMLSVAAANINRLYQDGKEANCLNTNQIPKWVEVGTDTERTARGAHTELIRNVVESGGESDQTEGAGASAFEDETLRDLYTRIAIRESELRRKTDGESAPVGDGVRHEFLGVDPGEASPDTQ